MNLRCECDSVLLFVGGRYALSVQMHWAQCVSV